MAPFAYNGKIAVVMDKSLLYPATAEPGGWPGPPIEGNSSL
jgi:hypothetical protein